MLADRPMPVVADEATARQLKQARTDLQAATERAKLPLPSEEPLKAAEDNLRRLEQVVATGNVPAVDYEKAKSEMNRLRGAKRNSNNCSRARRRSSAIPAHLEGMRGHCFLKYANSVWKV